MWKVSFVVFPRLQLASTEEYVDGAFTGNLGEVLIRYGNFLWLKPFVHHSRTNSLFFVLVLNVPSLKFHNDSFEV